MVEIKCDISGYTAGKRGGKITFTLNAEQAKKLETVYANFRDKPILLQIGIDVPERLKQLGQITDDQRKKIYALLKDIGNSFGEEEQNCKENMKQVYCTTREREMFSLSNCSKEEATDFIEFLVGFCLEYGVQLEVNPGEYMTDLQKYQLMCITNKVCCICGKPGEIHHYDAIGLSHRRGNPEDEATLRKMCLCREHHTEAHNYSSKEDFCRDYHVEPVLVG